MEVVSMTRAIKTDPEELNLDSMSPDSLWNLHDGIKRHPRLAARELACTVNAARCMANYAANKAVAMKLRSSGSVQRALVYEEICDQLYKELPEGLRW